MGPLYPLLSAVLPHYVTTTELVGRAMIEVAEHGAAVPVLENREINEVARARGRTVQSKE
ncbi:MAG: epimerase [Gemmatimonadetes bacterium]|nr:epimerase [Gemmatimonadota bacterium]